MSADTTGADERTPEEVEEAHRLEAELGDTQPMEPVDGPVDAGAGGGGEPAPTAGRVSTYAAPDLSGDKPVVGLKGDAIAVPRGIWYAAVDDQGNPLTDAEGRVVRVHPPSTRPRIPLAQLVAGTLAP